jgi:hypothetical protein
MPGLLSNFCVTHTVQEFYTCDEIQFITSIKLLHVSASGFQSQGVFQSKGIQVQLSNLGSASYRQCSTSICVLDLYPFVLEESLRMAPPYRNM